jgi:uncharacterized protein (PEP-CTERM system associated)
LLPSVGIGTSGTAVRLGDLGDPFATPLAGPPLQPAGRAWTVTPSIRLTEEYVTGAQTTGARITGASVGSQFITIVQPSLVAGGRTTRLDGELSYTPQVEFYAPDGNQNQVAQDFNGRLLVTLVPQTLFLDLRGSGAVQSVLAGLLPNQTSTLASADATQTYSFAASPYALHRFGDWGTAEIGASLERTSTSALQNGGVAAAANQSVTTTGGHAAFVTGEAFARYNGAALAETTNFAGTGVLSGAYRNAVSIDNGYAMTRRITALATLGWEDIHYSGSAPLHIDDAVWNIGVRLEPSPDSTITIRYGHQDGLDAFSVDAAVQPTARTHLYARYSEGLTTTAEQLQNALATSDLDTQGNPIDHTTGAPLVPIGDFFGLQNSLYKTTLASLTGVLLLDRDTLSLSFESQTQILVSAGSAAGLAAGNTSGLFGTVSWSHALRPNLESAVSVQYGTQRNDGPPADSQQLVGVSASLSYALSPTLSGSVQFSYNQSIAANPVGGAQGLFLVSLVKTF